MFIGCGCGFEPYRQPNRRACRKRTGRRACELVGRGVGSKGAALCRDGDWGRDAVLWLGRHVGRLSLAELGKLAGGLDYAVVSKAIARFSQRLVSDTALRAQMAVLQNQLPK